MILVTGHLRVDPGSVAGYLHDCIPIVALARQAPGCLDYAVSADILETGRINVFEKWATAEELHAFRGAGPDEAMSAEILSASIEEYTL